MEVVNTKIFSRPSVCLLQADVGFTAASDLERHFTQTLLTIRARVACAQAAHVMTLHQVDAAKHKIEKESALVVMPGRQRVPLPCPELPELVLSAIDAVVVSARQRALL